MSRPFSGIASLFNMFTLEKLPPIVKVNMLILGNSGKG